MSIDLRTASGGAARPASAGLAVGDGPLLLYDGDCGLCAKSVQWLLAKERDHSVRFAPLQGETTAALRERYPNIPTNVDTVVYIDGKKAHLRSKAFLHAAKHLRAPWRWGYFFRWVPGFLMNWMYRFIAAIRFRIWGRADACQLVPPETRPRFLP